MKGHWLLPLLIASTTLHGAELYRSVAPDGTVSYGDRPLTNDAEVVRMTVAQPSPPSRSVPMAAAAEEASPGGTTETTAAGEPTLEELRQQKEQNCIDARQQLTHVTSTDNLYRTLPGGDMAPLDAEQIEEVRAKAQAEVEAWCE